MNAPFAWAELVDLERLGSWMNAQGLPPGAITDIRTLGGGTQNLLLQFCRGGRTFVLRRPPLHPQTDGNRTMRREMGVLQGLAGTEVPHPRLIAGCEGTEVLGAAFYLMEPVQGFNASVALPPLHAGDPDIRRRMGLALARGAAALAQVDPAALRLGGADRRFVPAAEPDKWHRYLESYREHVGWPGPGGLPLLEDVRRWLHESPPPDVAVGLTHGDYHLANVMYRPDGPELAAIVDWELAYLGDPLVDLGWLLATWPDAEGVSPVGLAAAPWTGFPAAQELIDEYSRHSTRDLGRVRWYGVFACYKLAILLEGSFARACAGAADVPTGDRLHRCALRLLPRAQQWMDAGEGDNNATSSLPP